MSPVKLVVGRGHLLSQIYRLLGFHGRFGSSGSSSSHRKPWLLPPKHSRSSSSSSKGNEAAPQADAAAREQAAASTADDGSAVRGIEVWSGPLRVALEAPGKFRTDRVDMIIGKPRLGHSLKKVWWHHPCRYVCLCCWWVGSKNRGAHMLHMQKSFDSNGLSNAAMCTANDVLKHV